MELLLNIIGTTIWSVISGGLLGLVSYIVDKIYGRKVICFRFLCFRWNNTGGFYTDRFTISCIVYSFKQDDTDSAQIVSDIIKLVLYTALNACVIALAIAAVLNRDIPLAARYLLEGAAMFSVVIIITDIIMTIRYFSAPKNSLAFQVRRISKSMVAGVPFGQIYIPDYRVFAYTSATKFEIANYQHFAFMNRLWYGNFNDFTEITGAMERALDITYKGAPKITALSMITVFYDLLFYYSCMEINYDRAWYIYNIIEQELLNDKDSNGYRTLAYFTYFVRRDYASAANYLKEGLKVLDSFPLISQRELEGMLMNKLLNAVDSEQRMTYFML